jgi:uncharacterized membrane protein (UPF0127 family)
MKFIRIINQTNQASRPILAKYCQSFFCQLRGLMFTRSIPEDHGLLLVQGADSRLNASIHMMFMWMDLAIIWINSEYSVVDLVLACAWKMAYFPKKPARYILETSVSHIQEFNIGDKVRFDFLSQDFHE